MLKRASRPTFLLAVHERRQCQNYLETVSSLHLHHHLVRTFVTGGQISRA